MPRAVVCRELGPPERLRLEVFAPMPLQNGQVRVAIHAAGINFPDILMVAGEYQLKPELPFTPGMEAAGEVSEIAEGVDGFTVGDRVIVKLRHGGGGGGGKGDGAPLCPPPKNLHSPQRGAFFVPP